MNLQANDREAAEIAGTVRQSGLIKVSLCPCPFCGSKAQLREDSGAYMIGCSDVCCGVHLDTGWSTDKDKIITAWNSRKGA